MLMRQRGPIEDPDPAYERERRGWFWRSRVVGRGSLVFCLLIMAGLVYLAVAPLLDTPDPAPSIAGGTTATAEPTAAPEPESGGDAVPPQGSPAAAGCPEQPRQEVAPETVVLNLFDTAWRPVGSTLLPTSDGAGPSKPGPAPACYSRTPEGALYAAAAFYQLAANTLTPADAVALVEARVSRSGAYAQAISELQSDTQIADSQAPANRIVGYRWLGYTPDLAQVDFQYLWTAGSRVGTTFTLASQVVWEANDWLVVAPNQNSQLHIPPSSGVVYTPWGPSQ